MNGFDRKIRLSIFRELKERNLLWSENGGLNKVELLNKIWDLRSLSSSDPRFTDAYKDATQHLQANDDWEDDYIFLDRFGLLDSSEDVFVKFLNAELSPEVRFTKDAIDEAVRLIEPLLPKDYEIKEYADRGGLPVFLVTSISARDRDEYPIGIEKNTIPFYVDHLPTQFPAFKLETNNWDDYGYKTTSKLYYYGKDQSLRCIGEIKILQGKHDRTNEVLGNTFVSLDDSFCSLGQDASYYRNLKSIFPNNFKTILYALKDAAYYPEVLYRCENLIGFKNSLVRFSNAQEALTKARKILEGGNTEDYWKFSFNANLPYADAPLQLMLNFGDVESLNNPYRVKALIGDNGVGKTSILKSLVNQLIRDEGEFRPAKPLFSKVIAISFSIFDTFINLRGKSVLTYTYCGLHNKEDSIMSVDDRKIILRNAIDWINKDAEVNLGSKSIIRKFEVGLRSFFSNEFVESLFLKEKSKLNVDKIMAISSMMSSGESMILNLVASLYANIRKNSLIVFDEMEVHLHPTAIRKMMKLLFIITEQYESACLLATHSSIVVQELLADNVYIIKKLDNSIPEVRRLNHESLGENLSTISDEIFGEMSLPRHYKKFIRERAELAHSFDQLLEMISSEGLPPSLSLYFDARRIFESEKNDKDSKIYR